MKERMFRIFSKPFEKMSASIHRRVENGEPGLYIYLIFPILVFFLLTFVGSRIISYTIPQVYLELSPGLHIHHFTYGFFVLAAAGYLALIFSGPRAKYYIASLFGIGLGLAFDEFAMWIRLSDEDPARWSYDGFTIVILVFLTIILIKPGIRTMKRVIFRR